ncbi:4-hydroxybenzoate polyprenyltransferase [Rubellimicrobium mesophilum DSM 19309]|uniref:4-hydroxybenzoate octaprenyltransferase n=1 Tax=Rubellimicrobium mesophilum DSM 19309 TaxID=442562 RepID=A0A017HPN3_9RHOB|nr:4-hydroxybenzoate octaprenyltransferase [Rubellimicrobium mesophilum]EYD75724.1 4-hydroxybenzoate polyprenyltransferase [Rubellimicrobium mesophilum DSM 19309]
MSGTIETPEPGAVPDAAPANWVDLHAPRAWRPYLRLSRADRPIGTWLLLLPCWWGLGLALVATGARPSHYDLWIALACALGAFLMRGAGCTWNDITDRDIDARVARTRARPIPSGQVTVRQALLWLAAQAGLSLLILLTLPPVAIGLGVLSLVPVALYPFAKRVTWWPQAVLGVAFNWGALLAYAAHAGRVEWPAVALWLGGIAWTLFYDTIYAHQDVEDDAVIGVKSTARLFGEATPLWLRRFLVATVLLIGLAVVVAALDASPLALILALAGPWAMGWHLAWQLQRFDPEDPRVLLRLFRSNRDAGLITAVAFALAALA